ncbi:MAG TPA: hypothetical protein VM578_12090 [Candidatus Saccharimonadales bacterium]|nr:hypothetical protein [Candidatus Saccharimonadales bacterium]
MKNLPRLALLVAGIVGANLYLCAYPIQTGPSKAIDAESIRRVQFAPASEIEHGLPDMPFVDWLKSTVRPNTSIIWETNDCGEQDGSGNQESVPVCVDAEAMLGNELRLSIWIAVGSQNLREPGWRPPDFSTKPELFLVALSEGEHQLGCQLRLADLPGLRKLSSMSHEKVVQWCSGRLEQR